MSASWLPEAYSHLLAGDYQQVINCYEQAVQTEPEVASHYWYLGLAYLLQSREAETQATWLTPMLDASEDEVNQWTVDLQDILIAEAERQTALENYQLSWLVRAHLREVTPTDLNNLLHLIQAAVQSQTFAYPQLQDWNVLECLQQCNAETIDSALLLNTWQALLNIPEPELIDFLSASQHLVSQPAPFIHVLWEATNKLHILYQHPLAVQLAKFALKLDPKNLTILAVLTTIYIDCGQYEQALETAHQYLVNCPTLSSQVMGSYLILKALLGSGGRWQEVWQALALHETLLRLLLEEANLILSPSVATLLQSSTFFFPYLRDQPARNRYWHNQIAQLCQACHQSQAPNFSEQHQQRHAIAKSANASRKLRVGYISHCLKQHSVGWLSRWLFQYHQQQDFEWSLYLISHETDPFSAQWFASRVNMVRTYEMPEPVVVAQDIFDDQIDILIDLDSLTVDRTMSTLALKPAPIQVTWLGWDASGLPAIDYFIADPYVLPDNAQDYYQESIWRLPQTYVAVDGFEVSVPTLRRDQLDIPTDAIIYLTAQRGYKRHPDTVRLQLQILKDVPNSYLLVKGIADDAAIQDFFNQLADDVGVDPGRLRFLERDPSEPVHRANLQIADVVLDTYPYNGATTTLETLWMGIPLVTRVGNQFAARNSYAFMTNAGITEGIAWTNAEYVEWGVRLGKDEALRQLIHWKLKASRQTSPLWNAKQFTHNMEQAYQQMWAKYCELIIPAQVYSDPK